MCDRELLKVDRCGSVASKAARSARRRAGWSAIVPCRTMRRPAWSSLWWCRVMIRLRLTLYSRVDTLVQKSFKLELRYQCLCVARCSHVDTVLLMVKNVSNPSFKSSPRFWLSIHHNTSVHLQSNFDCMSIALLLYRAMFSSLHVMSLPAMVYPQSSYLEKAMPSLPKLRAMHIPSPSQILSLS